MADDADEPARAKKKAKKDKPADNGKKGKKGKNGKNGKKDAAGVSVAGHPRAAAAVRRAKGLGGLVGFGLAALQAHQAGLAIDQVAERALIAGIAGYLLAWACAVAVWRHIVLAQATALAERIQRERPGRPTIPLAAAPAAPAPPGAAPSETPGADAAPAIGQGAA